MLEHTCKYIIRKYTPSKYIYIYIVISVCLRYSIYVCDFPLLHLLSIVEQWYYSEYSRVNFGFRETLAIFLWKLYPFLFVPFLFCCVQISLHHWIVCLKLVSLSFRLFSLIVRPHFVQVDRFNKCDPFY